MFGFDSGDEYSRVRADYKKGREDVLNAKHLNRRGRKMIFWLPVGLVMARAALSGAETVDYSIIPKWSNFIPVERKALRIAHAAMHGGEINLMAAHTHLGELIFAIRQCAQNHVKMLDDKLLDRGLLDMEHMTSLEMYQSIRPTPHEDPPFTLPLFIAKLVQNAVSAEMRFSDRLHSLPDPGFAISATDAGFLGWMEEFRDPDFWPVFVKGINHDLDATLPIIEWIVRQPDCDRATAAMIFVTFGGDSIVGKNKGDLRAEEERICAYICDRLNDGGYARQELSLSGLGFADDQSERFKRFSALAPSSDIPSPAPLFEKPFSGRAPTTPYYIHSEDIVEVALI
ncbi:DUF4274 domain-containing protein [Ruegeria atlantica]|uniref:DUF4274 domain-containing protein n=1 Tax=Ruegeria atlantica TaxID=81569 RepID=UPI00148198D2|nr:DUF4274 domain-containing protein [Ruegeria atlantica]